MTLAALIDLQFRLRRWILWGLALGLALALVGLAGLRFDFSPQRVFESGDAEFRFLEQLQEDFGRDDNRVVLHVRSRDLFAGETLRYLRALHDELGAIDGLERVDGLVSMVLPGLAGPQLLLDLDTDATAARRSILSQPLVAGRVVSEDGTSTLISLTVDPEHMGVLDLQPIVDGISRVVDRVPRPAGVGVGIVGIPVARVRLVARLIADQLTYLPVCLVVFTVVLWLLYRDLRAVFVPLAAVLVSLVLVAGAMGAAGVPIDIINNVLPTLLLVIGVSDAIHLVSRYRQELVGGQAPGPALRTASLHLSVAVFLTSLTTAIGFSSLAIGRLAILRRFGLWAAGGVMVTWVVTIVLVPLVLSRLRPTLGAASRRANRRAERAADWMAGFTTRRRWPIAALGVVVLVASLWMAQRVEVVNSLFESFTADDPLVVDNRTLEQSFPGVVPFSVAVSWSEEVSILDPRALAYLAELQEHLSSRPEVGDVVSLIDLLAEANAVAHGGDPAWRRPGTSLEQNQALATLLTAGLGAVGEERMLASIYRPDLRRLRIQARVGDIGSRALAALASDLRARLEEGRGRQAELGIECRLSGGGIVGSAAVDRLIGDMFRSVVVAFVVIFGILLIVLRSWRAACVSMVPNVFPLVLTGGILGAVGMDLQVPTIIVFSVALGLAVDDTIHFMVRYREEVRASAGDSGDVAAALRRTFRGTGQAIFATSAVLATGYAVLLLSRFPITQKFGLGMLLTVVGALIGDLLLLPACIAIVRPFARRRPLDSATTR